MWCHLSKLNSGNPSVFRILTYSGNTSWIFWREKIKCPENGNRCFCPASNHILEKLCCRNVISLKWFDTACTGQFPTCLDILPLTMSQRYARTHVNTCRLDTYKSIASKDIQCVKLPFSIQGRATLSKNSQRLAGVCPGASWPCRFVPASRRSVRHRVPAAMVKR